MLPSLHYVVHHLEMVQLMRAPILPEICTQYRFSAPGFFSPPLGATVLPPSLIEYISPSIACEVFNHLVKLDQGEHFIQRAIEASSGDTECPQHRFDAKEQLNRLIKERESESISCY